ncbi:MAG: hypothetical protein N2037_05445 [Acidimicrobiales bacterium]|nr:hypothetical protein [Acidimicrobiales bacterium]
MSSRVASTSLRRFLCVLLVVVGLCGLTACQAAFTVDTKVNEDGSGVITVGLGLDDKALARLGDPDRTVEVQDMKAVGWEVESARKEADGLTWIRARKRFASLDEANDVLGSLNPATLREFRVEKSASIAQTDWRFSGTIDLTGGLEAFSDPEVAALLGGDFLGGRAVEIEQLEGRPIADMISFRMSVELPGAEAPASWSPSLRDPDPTQVVAETSQRLPIPLLPVSSKGGSTILLVVLVGTGGLGALVALRRRFRMAPR